MANTRDMRVTWPGAPTPFMDHVKRWATAVPGSALAALTLILLLSGSLQTGFRGVHVALLAMLGIAALLRQLKPPTAKGPAAEWLHDADLVVLPMAAIAVVGGGLSADASLVFPLALLVVVWSAASLTTRSLGLALGFLMLSEIARFVGRGAWSGEATELAMHLAFASAFAAGGSLLLRHEVSSLRKRVEADAQRDLDASAEDARVLGIDGSAKDAVQMRDRVMAMRQVIDGVLQMARGATNAHSVVLMTRVGDALRVQYAATSETLWQDAVPVNMGLAAVLARTVAESGEGAVFRLSPIEGRTPALPYYEHTPARVKSLMAVASSEELELSLWFDRTAGDAFGDDEVVQAHAALRLVSQSLEMERTRAASVSKTEVLDLLLEASTALGAAFGPDQVHRAVLEQVGRFVPLRFSALVLAEGDGCRIVDALGDSAEKVRGRPVPEDTALAAVALRSGAAIPPSREWNAAHGSLLGSDVGPAVRDGEPVLVLPLAAHETTVGALVLIATEPLDDGKVNALSLLARQAAEAALHARSLAELRALATTDALTGIDNRGTVLKKLDQSLARASRRNQEVAVLLLDVDHFKRVNDTHGHPVGDAVLRQVSRTLEASKRVNDSVGRYGGEEFAIVLEDTGDAGARLVAERIRQRIASLQMPGRTGAFRVTVSIGFSIFSRDGEAAEELIRRADKALYQAKNSGRDQVRGFRDGVRSVAANG